jgi:hypothetical protein
MGWRRPWPAVEEGRGGLISGGPSRCGGRCLSRGRGRRSRRWGGSRRRRLDCERHMDKSSVFHVSLAWVPIYQFPEAMWFAKYYMNKYQWHLYNLAHSYNSFSISGTNPEKHQRHKSRLFISSPTSASVHHWTMFDEHYCLELKVDIKLVEWIGCFIDLFSFLIIHVLFFVDLFSFLFIHVLFGALSEAGNLDVSWSRFGEITWLVFDQQLSIFVIWTFGFVTIIV